MQIIVNWKSGSIYQIIIILQEFDKSFEPWLKGASNFIHSQKKKSYFLCSMI